MTTLEHKLAEGFIHEMMKHADTTVPTIKTDQSWLDRTRASLKRGVQGLGMMAAPGIANFMGTDNMNQLAENHIKNNPGVVTGMAKNFMGTDQGKRFVEEQIDSQIKDRIQPEFRDLVNKNEQGQWGVDKSKIPGYLMNQAGSWIKANPDKAILGGGALLGGGMLLSSMFSGNNNNQQQGQPQSITPQGYQPPKTTFNKFSVANDEDIRQYVLNSIYDSN